MRAMLAIAALLAALQVDGSRLRWVPNPRTTNGSWVVDPAHHLRPATVATVDSIISDLERTATAELAVVVIDSLDGLEPGAAALLLHRRWGVGKASRDNGMVLLWSPAMRQVFVSVGYGLEGVLPDARVGRIQDESIIPAFRRNAFDAGIVAGVRALAGAAREETYSGLARSQAARPAAETPRSRGAVAGFIVGGLVGFAAFILGLGLLWRRFPRRCPKGHGWMRRLSEAEDDAAIGDAGALEERLGSVDYDVWACRVCDQRSIIPHRKLFSRYGRCPQCQRRTLESIETVIVRATHSSAGRKKVRRHCRNCGFRDEREMAIPMLQSSSSSSGGGFSSGGGGGSFGGGSSGGGGAGRSY